MEKESIHGLMVKYIKATSLMTRDKAMEYSNGLMENNMKVIGKMASNMVKVDSYFLTSPVD